MMKTMRTLYTLAVVVILGTLVYAQEAPKTGTGGVNKPQTSAQPNTPNLVKSLNDLQGDVTLQAGTNITITPSGNMLMISAPNALTGIAHDNTLTGNGTAASPLSIAPKGPVNGYVRGTVLEIPNLGSGGESPLIDHPSDSQVVVEFVSALCTIPTGQKLVALILQSQFHNFVPTFSGTTGGQDYFVVSQPVKFYLNPGEHVFALALRSSPVGAGQCGITLSGHLIPVPTP